MSSTHSLRAWFSASLVVSVLLLAACTSPDDDDSGGGDGGGNFALELPVVPDSALNHITMKIDGHTYTMANVDVYRYSPVGRRQVTAENAAVSKGAVTTQPGDTHKFHDNYLSNAAVTVSTTLTGDSIQTCGAAATNAAITVEFGNNLSDWGGTYTATTCQVKVTYLSSSGGLMGVILSATLAKSNGKTFTITNAPFRVFHHTGFKGNAPVLTGTDAWHGTLQIDSGTFELAAGQYFKLYKSVGQLGSSFGLATGTSDGSKFFSGNASDIISFYAQSVPGSAGTFLCGQSYSGGTTNIQVWLGTYQSELAYTRANGSCSLTVVGQGNGAKMVTYTGRLTVTDPLLSPAQKRIKVSGMYRTYNLGKKLAGGSEGDARPDSMEAILKVDSGSYHFPKGGQYRVAKSGDAQKVSGLNALNAFFVHGGTNRDFTLNLKAVPAALGTYACGALVPGTNPSAYRTAMEVTTADTTSYAGIRYNAYTTSESPGANCSITVDSVSTARVAGRYTATLIATGAKALLPDGDTTLTVSGTFRAKGLP